MKLTVLIDNNTYIDQYLLGEPALSFHVEIGQHKILFDTGYSQAFLYNANKLGINLSQLTHLVFSHGHNDHTRGLKYLSSKINLKNIDTIAHPDCFLPKKEGTIQIDAPFSIEEM